MDWLIIIRDDCNYLCNFFSASSFCAAAASGGGGDVGVWESRARHERSAESRSVRRIQQDGQHRTVRRTSCLQRLTDTAEQEVGVTRTLAARTTSPTSSPSISVISCYEWSQCQSSIRNHTWHVHQSVNIFFIIIIVVSGLLRFPFVVSVTDDRLMVCREFELQACVARIW